MRLRTRRVLVGAALLAVSVVAAVLARSYLDPGWEGPGEARRVPVLVATAPIAEGTSLATAIAEGRVASLATPQQFRPTNALGGPGPWDGTATVDIPAGALLTSDLVPGATRAVGADLAEEDLEEDARRVPALAVVEAVPAGTPADEALAKGWIRAASVPIGLLPAGSPADAGAIRGTRAAIALSPGTIVIDGLFRT